MDLRSSVRRLPGKVYYHARPVYHWERCVIEQVEWEVGGMPDPPSHFYKIALLRKLAVEYKRNVFVETGTFRGDTTYALSGQFDRCVTIEVDQVLFEAALERFRGKPNIQVIRGDSGKIIPEVLNGLTGAAIFWLDGHYSGVGTGMGHAEAPIRAELEAILRPSRFDHIVAIDDARLFDGTND